MYRLWMGFYQFFVQNALVLSKLVRVMFTIFIFIKVKLIVALPVQFIRRSRIHTSVLFKTAYVNTQSPRDCIVNTRIYDGIYLGSLMPAYLGNQTLCLQGGQET